MLIFSNYSQDFFFFIFDFWQFDYCVGILFFEFILLGIWWTSGIHGKFSATLSLNIFLCTNLFLYSLFDCSDMNVRSFDIVPDIFNLCSSILTFIFSTRLFYLPVWVFLLSSTFCYFYPSSEFFKIFNYCLFQV